MEEWRSPLGYHQKSQWRHLDRLHEEVVEIESPFACKFASGTTVFHFLLTGDQNAGKSTFLHSFTDQDGPAYLDLLSIIPILSSSFINSRFLAKDDPAPPRDEGRFLDTDLGQASVVMTLDDFAFFVDEYGLSPSLVLDNPRENVFIALKFVEIGGDHLDRLMIDAKDRAIDTDDINAIIEKTRSTLKTCNQVIYFVNAHALLDDIEVITRLTDRLQYLNDTMPAGTQALILCTRGDIHPSVEALDRFLSSLRIRFSDPSLADSVPLEIDAIMTSVLISQAETRKWQLGIKKVLFTNHLREDGTADADAIVSSLSKFFRHDVIREASHAPYSSVVRDLLALFRDPHSRIDAEGFFSMWITEQSYKAFLEDAHDHHTHTHTHTHDPELQADNPQLRQERDALSSLPGNKDEDGDDNDDDNDDIPDVTRLSLYGITCKALCNMRLAIRHLQDNYGDFAIGFKFHATALPSDRVSQRSTLQGAKSPPASSIIVALPRYGGVEEGTVETNIRFPYNKKLLDACFMYFQQHVPDSFWLDSLQAAADQSTCQSTDPPPFHPVFHGDQHQEVVQTLRDLEPELRRNAEERFTSVLDTLQEASNSSATIAMEPPFPGDADGLSQTKCNQPRDHERAAITATDSLRLPSILSSSSPVWMQFVTALEDYIVLCSLLQGNLRGALTSPVAALSVPIPQSETQGPIQSFYRALVEDLGFECAPSDLFFDAIVSFE